MRAQFKFTENFVAARNALHLTQAEVGARMGTQLAGWNARTVRNLEGRERSVTLSEAEALAEIVCVPLDRMLTEPAAHVTVIAKNNMRGAVIA